ncbi:hypothetical protein MTR_3g108940 [Medicago truncatula]|uniref:Uncharacterized protein n=1 Tax=Medicago truncatula TaxID=3880 RepID=G7J2S7_MEDTR|nr:hypothetical protein MTR_3g108940 [Medicago truncatula]
MSGSRQLLEEPNHAGMRGILRPCMYETTWLKEAHSIRTPQLSVLDLEQFWDG